MSASNPDHRKPRHRGRADGARATNRIAPFVLRDMAKAAVCRDVYVRIGGGLGGAMGIATSATGSELMRLDGVMMRAIAPCSGLIAAVAAKMQSAALEQLSGDGWSGQSLQWDAAEPDACPAAIEHERDKPPVARNAKIITAAKVRPTRSVWTRRMRSRSMWIR
jgi:hypothetical protein